MTDGCKQNRLLQQALDILKRGYLLDGERITFEFEDSIVVLKHDGTGLIACVGDKEDEA